MLHSDSDAIVLRNVSQALPEEHHPARVHDLQVGAGALAAAASGAAGRDGLIEALRGIDLTIAAGADGGHHRAQRLGQEHAAQADHRHLRAHRRHDRDERPHLARCWSWAPASTRTSPAGRTSSSTASSSACRARRSARGWTRSSSSASWATSSTSRCAPTPAACTCAWPSRWPRTSDPEILIIDEILAVGDEHFSQKSMAKMTEFKAGGEDDRHRHARAGHGRALVRPGGVDRRGAHPPRRPSRGGDAGVPAGGGRWPRSSR